jgi:uncharacterized protein
MSTVEEVGMRKRSAGVGEGDAGSRRADGDGSSRRSGAKGAPRRTCVVCRSTTTKRTLHRIVRSPAGTVAYDPTGKAPGRGAYLCGQPACLDMAVRRGSVQRALRVTDAAAANAAVEALRNRMWSESTVDPAPRSSDDEEVRSG